MCGRYVLYPDSETIDSKSMFKNPFLNKRCLIPASSYYEWKKEPSGKIKYEIRTSERSLFFMAGLYNTFTDKSNNTFNGFVIITTSANRKTSEIHSRMPVILEYGQERLWLDNRVTDAKVLKGLLKPYSDSKTIFKIA